MPDTAITIGNFDGVHIGHECLVRKCREEVGPSGRVIVMTFSPHPATLLHPSKVPELLTTLERRIELLLAAGADEVVRLEPTKELLSLSPEAFIAQVVESHAPRVIVEGADFRFGANRAGNMQTLHELATRFGFRTPECPAAMVNLSDEWFVKASSTLVRRLLTAGRVHDVALILGRYHRLEGMIRRGDRRGRTVGFPTANLVSETAIPSDGVYAGVSILPDGRRFPCMLNVGTRPTVNGLDRRVEVHMIDAPGEGERIQGISEYDWRLKVDVVAWIRDQMKFPSFEHLVAQLHRDRDRARRLLSPSVSEFTSR
jgi:riboflavin kinase/FMN adenylyltransferase